MYKTPIYVPSVNPCPTHGQVRTLGRPVGRCSLFPLVGTVLHPHPHLKVLHHVQLSSSCAALFLRCFVFYHSLVSSYSLPLFFCFSASSCHNTLAFSHSLPLLLPLSLYSPLWLFLVTLSSLFHALTLLHHLPPYTISSFCCLPSYITAFPHISLHCILFYYSLSSSYSPLLQDQILTSLYSPNSNLPHPTTPDSLRPSFLFFQ